MPARIELQPSSAVVPVQNGNVVRWYVNGTEEFLYPVGRLWHVPGYTRPGSPMGISVVAHHASTIARGLTAGKFGTDFFTDGAKLATAPATAGPGSRDPGNLDALRTALSSARQTSASVRMSTCRLRSHALPWSHTSRSSRSHISHQAWACEGQGWLRAMGRGARV